LTRDVYLANIATLKSREKEIFDLLSEIPPDEKVPCNWIAGKLCVTKKTVDWHMRKINRKMGVVSMIALVSMKNRIDREQLKYVGTYLYRGNNPKYLFEDGILESPSSRKGGGTP
jgi:DNA-binding CsgD family transcriptional regulator